MLQNGVYSFYRVMLRHSMASVPPSVLKFKYGDHIGWNQEKPRFFLEKKVVRFLGF